MASTPLPFPSLPFFSSSLFLSLLYSFIFTLTVSLVLANTDSVLLEVSEGNATNITNATTANATDLVPKTPGAQGHSLPKELLGPRTLHKGNRKMRVLELRSEQHRVFWRRLLARNCMCILLFKTWYENPRSMSRKL